jgi:sporulation protein YlmC with PRC-barrel domain
MKSLLKTGLALVVLATALPATSHGQNAVSTTPLDTVDAGAIIGKDVVDAQGNMVGEIDSVMVDDKGQVQSVIVDVGGWLQGNKLIPVAWTNLRQTEDGKIVTGLSKESAAAIPPYNYADNKLRGKVIGNNGRVYKPEETSRLVSPVSPVINPDGTINTSKVLGLNIEDGNGHIVGEIEEVVLDQNGAAQGVVVDVGGFLGIGTHAVLLNWKDIQLNGQQGKVNAVVNATKERLKALPAYDATSR